METWVWPVSWLVRHQELRRRVTQSGSHARVMCATRRMVLGSQRS
jgi:hypothetical protein